LASLLVEIEKNIFSFWVWGSLWGTSQAGVFLLFGELYPAVGANPMNELFG